MPDLVDEVDEELRAERAKRLAGRYGGIAAGVALLALAGVGAWEGWKWNEQRLAANASGAFLSAAQASAEEGADLPAVARRFGEVAAQAPAGYATLARLRQAALLAEAGDLPGALALWDALARDGSADDLYRDLATLMWALHGLDTGNAGQIEARVGPLAREGQPWRASAREVLALAQLRRGAEAEARTGLRALVSDPATPQGVRDRAGRVLAGLGG